MRRYDYTLAVTQSIFNYLAHNHIDLGTVSCLVDLSDNLYDAPDVTGGEDWCYTGIKDHRDWVMDNLPLLRDAQMEMMIDDEEIATHFKDGAFYTLDSIIRHYVCSTICIGLPY